MEKHLHMAAAGAGGVLIALLLMAPSPMSIRSDGLEFPDGTVQTTAAVTDTRRAFYLSQVSANGAQVAQMCEEGFHFASLWEILDVSNLRYAKEVPSALIAEDSTDGLPSGLAGWVATGRSALSIGQLGRANCDAWKSAGEADFGTMAELEDLWSQAAGDPLAPEGYLGPWDGQLESCQQNRFFWCVED